MFDNIYILEFCSGSDEESYRSVEPVAFRSMQEAIDDLIERGYYEDNFGIYRYDITNGDSDNYFADSSYTIKKLQLIK